MRLFFMGPRLFGGLIRPGISFSGSEISSAFKRMNSANPESTTGSFIYVIKDEIGRSKIGVSKNPLQRIATLQTGSSHLLEFAYIGVTPCSGYEIEGQVKAMFQKYRTNGGDEWFAVEPAALIAALNGVAYRVNQPIQPLTKEQTAQVLQVIESGIEPTQQRLPFYKRFLPIVVITALCCFAVMLFALH